MSDRSNKIKLEFDIKGSVFYEESSRTISARVSQKYKNLKDDELVTFILDDDLEVGSRFTAKGQPIIGTAWIIGERVQIDLGYGHKVILYDFEIKKGIGLSALKKKRPTVLLHIAILKK